MGLDRSQIHTIIESRRMHPPLFSQRIQNLLLLIITQILTTTQLFQCYTLCNHVQIVVSLLCPCSINEERHNSS